MTKKRPFLIPKLLVIAAFIHGCNTTNGKKGELNNNKHEMTTETLIEAVKLAINPKCDNWVLFENGTYIIFDNVDSIADLEMEAVKLMKKFGPVHGGGPAGDFSVISLTETEGWVISGHGYGMYTYVHPNEMEISDPQDLDVGLYGRSKRDMDGSAACIIYVQQK